MVGVFKLKTLLPSKLGFAEIVEGCPVGGNGQEGVNFTHGQKQLLQCFSVPLDQPQRTVKSPHFGQKEDVGVHFDGTGQSPLFRLRPHGAGQQGQEPHLPPASPQPAENRSRKPASARASLAEATTSCPTARTLWT